jgi:hypothetical protein
MHETSTPMIRQLLVDCCDRQGWILPEDIVNYCTMVLADHVTRPNWQPQPSYAEQFMTVRTVQQYISLGNECWFTRAVFPELMERRGIKSSYYVDMGTACFDQVVTKTAHPTVRKIRDHFEFTCEVCWTAIHARDGFRSMWD